MVKHFKVSLSQKEQWYKDGKHKVRAREDTKHWLLLNLWAPELVKESNPLNFCANGPFTSADHTAVGYSRDFRPLFGSACWFPTVNVKKKKELFTLSFLFVSDGSSLALYIWVGMWYCECVKYNSSFWQCMLTHKLVKIQFGDPLHQRIKFMTQYEKFWLNMQSCEHHLVALFV